MPPRKSQQRRLLGEALKKAATGEPKFAWLAKLASGAGYVLPDPAGATISQKALVMSIPGVTRTTVLDWEARGLAAVKNGRAKRYRIIDVVTFLHEEYVSRGRPASEDGANLVKWKATHERYKSEIARMRMELQTGRTIPRAEAEAKLVELILVMKAALLALPAQVSRQVGNVPAAEARETLERYVEWLCERMQEGKPPLPAKLERAIRESTREQAATGPEDSSATADAS
jgi:hypothetical protein